MHMQVVPFSPAAGLLEWVEDTVPLGRYLIGEDRMSGAHRRYARPGELSFFESYTAMDKGVREGRPRQAFDKVQYLLQPFCPKERVTCCLLLLGMQTTDHPSSFHPWACHQALDVTVAFFQAYLKV